MIRSTRIGRGWWSGMLVLMAAALVSALPPDVVIAQDEEAGAEAEVLIVHGASDAGDLDLHVDGSLAFSGISYPGVSDVLTLAEGDHEFAVIPAGAGLDQAVASTTLALTAGETYHVAMLGLLQDLQVNVYAVDLSPLAPGQARIRVINGSPDTGPLDLRLSGGDPLFPSVSFPSETDYADIGADTVDIELIATDVETVVLSSAETELTAGTVYDLYAVGQLADDSLHLIQVASSGETATTGSSSASIQNGTCTDGATDDDAAVVAQLNGPVTASGESLGTANLSPVANSFTSVGLTLDEMLAAEHAVVVNRDAEQATGVVCGDIGGSLTETGALVVALREADGQSLAGMAILAPSAIEPGVTDVTLLLASASTGAGDDAAAEADGDEAGAAGRETAAPIPEIIVIDERESDASTDTS